MSMHRDISPFITQQIDDLRRSPDPLSQSQATMLEVLSLQEIKIDDIVKQTNLTNGRVTALEERAEEHVSCPGTCEELQSRCEEFHRRLALIEKPRDALRIVLRVAASTVTHVAVFCGIVFGFLNLEVGKAFFARRDNDIAALTARQLAENDRKLADAIAGVQEKLDKLSHK